MEALADSNVIKVPGTHGSPRERESVMKNATSHTILLSHELSNATQWIDQIFLMFPSLGWAPNIASKGTIPFFKPSVGLNDKIELFTGTTKVLRRRKYPNTANNQDDISDIDQLTPAGYDSLVTEQATIDKGNKSLGDLAAKNWAALQTLITYSSFVKISTDTTYLSAVSPETFNPYALFKIIDFTHGRLSIEGIVDNSEMWLLTLTMLTSPTLLKLFNSVGRIFLITSLPKMG